MRENLLGYLLGALDDDEQASVERQLAIDAKLRDDLQKLREQLTPLEQVKRREPEAPPGLATRTCNLIRSVPALRCLRTADRAAREAVSGARWTLADVSVAAGICLAAALLFFPVIAGSRQQARDLACLNNLRQLGLALNEYSQLRNGYFPHIPTTGNRAVAGYFAPQLREAGLLRHEAALLCPAIVQAGERKRFRVPSTLEIDAAGGERLFGLWRTMGGTYSYNLGIRAHDSTVPVRNRGRRGFAIMADSPLRASDGLVGQHRRGGLNILFEDMHVELLVEIDRAHGADDYFHNDYGLVQAGVHEQDSVIAGSATPPIPRQLPRPIQPVQMVTPR